MAKILIKINLYYCNKQKLQNKRQDFNTIAKIKNNKLKNKK